MNIYDVAEMAGVSIATVSRVVNDSDKVSEKTKQKVRRVMAEAGYTPNAFAQGLGLNTMHQIGILVPDISDIYMSAAVSHLHSILHENGYECLLSSSGFSMESKKARVSMLLNKRIDALILIGSTYAGSGKNPDEISYIREAAKSVPVFLINGVVEGDGICCSICDDYNATKQVTRRLIQFGRKRILFLTNSASFSANRKQAGYLAGLSEAGLPEDAAMIEKLPFSRIHQVRDFLLAREGLSFDACISTDDELAVGVLKFASERGIAVPDDLFVIGYNNSAFSVASSPELTSIDSRLESLCQNTAKAVLASLRGEEVPSVTTAGARLIERGTTRFS